MVILGADFENFLDFTAHVFEPVSNRFTQEGVQRVVFLQRIIKPYYVPGKVNKMTLIVNHSDFKVALDGISAHDAGKAFRIVLVANKREP